MITCPLEVCLCCAYFHISLYGFLRLFFLFTFRLGRGFVIAVKLPTASHVCVTFSLYYFVNVRWCACVQLQLVRDQRRSECVLFFFIFYFLYWKYNSSVFSVSFDLVVYKRYFDRRSWTSGQFHRYWKRNRYSNKTFDWKKNKDKKIER